MNNLENVRQDYKLGELNEENIPANPINLLKQWLEDAITQKVTEPTAISLATVDIEGKPDIRIVLLKEITERGIIFYTNYQSKKGQDLQNNPFAAANLFEREQN